MALGYSVRFAKQNSFGKIVMEKEGEVVFGRSNFRLKGKGANDQGELIGFGEIRELQSDKNQFIITGHSGDKYLLSRFGTAYSAFQEDFYKLRNEFFIENLALKQGMLRGEFECSTDVESGLGKSVLKGKCLLQIYENSLVFMPKLSDVFAINFNFLKRHEIDLDNYQITLENDNGIKVKISKLGSSFQDLADVLDDVMEKMFQKLLTSLSQNLEDNNLSNLLKLSSLMRFGKVVTEKQLKKIDISLSQKIWSKFEEACPVSCGSIKKIRVNNNEDCLAMSLYNFHQGCEQLSPWCVWLLPQENLGLIFHKQKNNEYCVGVKLTQENAFNKEVIEQRILEINQSMLALENNPSALTIHQKDLNSSKYKTQMQRFTFLKNLNRLVIGGFFVKTEEDVLSKFQSFQVLAKQNASRVDFGHRRNPRQFQKNDK